MDVTPEAIELSPDGRNLAGGRMERQAVRLFDVDRSVSTMGLPAVRNLQTPTFIVPGPTDDLVILGDQDWVMSYPTTPSAWLRTACEIVGRDLTPAEWDLPLPGRPWQATCSDLA